MVPRSTRMGLIVQRGIMGLGILVVAVSITQGLAGVIGSLLLIVVLGAVGSLGAWLAGAVQRKY